MQGTGNTSVPVFTSQVSPQSYLQLKQRSQKQDLELGNVTTQADLKLLQNEELPSTLAVRTTFAA